MNEKQLLEMTIDLAIDGWRIENIECYRCDDRTTLYLMDNDSPIRAVCVCDDGDIVRSDESWECESWLIADQRWGERLN